MKLIVQEPFKWAHQGVRVEEFAVGAEIETEDPDLIDVATREGWAAPEGAQQDDGAGAAPTVAPADAVASPAADAPKAKPAKAK